MKKVIIVGTIPEPVGGVSEFIYRLCNALSNHIIALIDLHPHGMKRAIPENIAVIPYPCFNTKIFLTVLNIFRTFRKADAIYFNASCSDKLIPLLFLPKLGKKWILTLHHGDLQNGWITLNSIKKYLSRNAIKRFDIITSLSSKQDEYYLDSMRINKNKIYNLKTYIRPIEYYNDQSINYPDGLERLLFDKNTVKIVISGYPLPEYNHEWIIDIANELHSNERITFIFFIYGNGDIEIENKIKTAACSNKRIHYFRNLNSSIFNFALSQCQVYVRPNRSDSFGIAVADAVNYGLDVIASDCCERYSGSIIFKAGDYVEFRSKLYTIISNSEKKVGGIGKWNDEKERFIEIFS